MLAVRIAIVALLIIALLVVILSPLWWGFWDGWVENRRRARLGLPPVDPDDLAHFDERLAEHEAMKRKDTSGT